jgi:hypothetical protein
MRDALGRLNTELYPPLKEIGFQVRSKGPAPLPALIEGTRRTKDGRSQAYSIPSPVEAPSDDTKSKGDEKSTEQEKQK